MQIAGSLCEPVSRRSRVDDPARGTVDDFHAGPVRRIVGLRLVMAEDGTIYRLLPQPLHRRMDPALLQRLGPAA
jgi:hypothetical protein